MRRERVTLSALLMMLNAAIYYISYSQGLPSPIIVWVAVAASGYVAGRGRDLLIGLLEYIALLLISLNTAPWASANYIIQNAAAVTVLYAGGFLWGSALGRQAEKTKLPPTQPKEYIPALLASTGIFLVSYSLLRGLTEASPLIPPAHASMLGRATYIAGGLLAASLAVYGRGNQPYLKTVIIGGLSALLSFIILPLSASLIPPQTKAVLIGEDCIIVGKVRKVYAGPSRKSIYCYRPRLGMNSHVILIGSSGSGKTRAAKAISRQAKGFGIPVIVIDIHGEYGDINGFRRVDGSVERVNPFALLGKEPGVRAEEVSSEVTHAYRLGGVQRAALNAILLKAYRELPEVNPSTLLELVKSGDYGDIPYGKEVISSLLPYLSSIAGSSLVRWMDPGELSDGSFLFDLSHVESPPLQTLIMRTVLDAVFYVRKAAPRTTLVVIEEAQRLTASGSGIDIMGKLFREGRKLGISAIAIYQDPGAVNPSLLNNASLIMVFKVLEESSLNYISRVLGGPSGKEKEVRRKLPTLRVGEAFILGEDGFLALIETQNY